MNTQRLVGGWWLTVLAVIVVWAAMPTLHPIPALNIPLSEHAVVVHGEDAERAKQCLDGDQQGLLFFHPGLNRYAVVCWLEDRWGIVILSLALTVITAFVCFKRKNANKVREYMRRQGYEER